ncbi:MAG TPA: amidohydrolase family protein [Acidobacteriota bacterium]|nr:amidohydrolase family protein [Acidobacteriota bacterium]
MNTLNDAHCHFFSRGFFEALSRGLERFSGPDRAAQVVAELEWEAPGESCKLARRWADELDRHQVDRCVLIASVPGDEDSVAEAVKAYPRRFVGFFMVDPTAPDAAQRTEEALTRKGLRGVCLFPAMQRFRVDQEPARRIFEIAAGVDGAAVFVHCGVLTVGVRKKLGLKSPFDIRCGNPLDLHRVAVDFPRLPVIIPHFGAGFLREALMVADLCPNIHFDTSSSNGWVRYCGLSLEEAFRRSLSVLGAGRLLFGSDSSFFPRGYQRQVLDAQLNVLSNLEVPGPDRQRILADNFNHLFPPG